MEDKEAINVIRESERNILMVNRRDDRIKDQDENRSIAAEYCVTQETALEIVNKLKTRSSISVEDLIVLKNYMAQDIKNIEIVLTVNGALRGLVRELTGHCERKQIRAAICISNLAATEAGARSLASTTVYILANLDSFNSELAVISARTIGNLAAAANRNVCNVLISQGAFSKLTQVFETNTEENVKEYALYALLQLSFTLKNNLSVECLRKCIDVLVNNRISASSARLLFHLSCHEQFVTVTDDSFANKVISNGYIMFLRKHLRECTSKKQVCCEFVYVSRVLSNYCISDLNSDRVLNIFCSNNDFVGLFKSLLQNNIANNEMLWFLGNLFKYSSDTENKTVFFSHFC